jgi:hypothetical protein
MTVNERLMDKLAKALEMNMEWIGTPPTDKHSFDSFREDAWRLGKDALRDYRRYLDIHKVIDGIGQCHEI